MCFEVVQEYAPSSSSGGSSAAVVAGAAATAGGGGKGEANMLGFVRLNLAEYVEVGNADSGEGGNGEVVRRYLMQGSKINSTLKVCPTLHYLAFFLRRPHPKKNILLRIYASQYKLTHTSSDRNPYDPNRRRNKLHRVPKPPSPSFLPPSRKLITPLPKKNSPALRSAPVFGGLASLSLPSADDSHPTSSHIPLATSVPPPTSSKTGITTRDETIKVQDMYRQTLAASWAAQTGELRADEVIEDIFGGGSGWRAGGRRRGRGNEEESEGEGDRRTLRGGEGGKEGVVSSSRRHSRVGSRAETVIVSTSNSPPYYFFLLFLIKTIIFATKI